MVPLAAPALTPMPLSGWALAKYVLALGGLALVLLGDSLQRSWISWAGLGLIGAAFFLRFAQRRAADAAKTRSGGD